MVSKYVFFRDPTGKAVKRNDGKHVPVQLLAELGKSSILQDDDSIGWKSWWTQHDALLSAFIILSPDGPELNSCDANTIIWAAFRDAARKAIGQPLKEVDVLKAADKQAADFFRQKSCNYILVTSLSIKRFPAKKITINGCEITPLANRHERFPLPKALNSGHPRIHFADHLNNSLYQWVKVACSGRTIHESVGNALNALNLLRALWSYPATIGRETMRSGWVHRKPIGVIHSGPVYTLHNSDGSAADEDQFWFDPDYTCDQDLFQNDSEWSHIEKKRRWAMRKLVLLPYKRDMTDILLRYIEALDQANPNAAFLQLWGVLEKITNTTAKYDETVERTCRIFRKSDRKVMKEILESLRHYRNRYVHSTTEANGSGELTYRIKSFVDPHIARLLNNTFQVKGLQEYGEFLSYPTDIETLRKKYIWTKRALRAAKEDESE